MSIRPPRRLRLARVTSRWSTHLVLKRWNVDFVCGLFGKCLYWCINHDIPESLHYCDSVRRRKLFCCAFRQDRFFSRVSTFPSFFWSMQSSPSACDVAISIIRSYCSLTSLFIESYPSAPPLIRQRYDTNLRSNYGDTFVDNLVASKTSVCTRLDESAAVALFYGERVGDDCKGANCFPHSYGGGIRIFEFHAYEIQGDVHRFLCPVKTNSKLYFIQLLPILFCFLSFQHSPRIGTIFNFNNLLDAQKELVSRLSPEPTLSPACDAPQSSQSPPTITLFLKRDSHLNNFHCAGPKTYLFLFLFLFRCAMRCIICSMLWLLPCRRFFQRIPHSQSP